LLFPFFLLLHSNTLISDPIDTIVDDLLSNSSVQALYSTKENTINTGALYIKPDTSELTAILDSFQTTSYSNNSGWDGTGITAVTTEGILAYYFSQTSSSAHVDGTNAISQNTINFAAYPECGKPWDCVYNDSWDVATEQECSSLHRSWYGYRRQFEQEHWSKTTLFNTTSSSSSSSTYHPDVFLGYCIGNGTYVRASDYGDNDDAPISPAPISPAPISSAPISSAPVSSAPISTAPIAPPTPSYSYAFEPLPCNDDGISSTIPCTPFTGIANSSEVYVIPCGTCQILDGNDFTTTVLQFAAGLNVEGHLQILPPTSGETLVLRLPFLIVQGKLTMTTPTDRFGSIHVEMVPSSEEVLFVPHAHNRYVCPNQVCNVGINPIVVAGGQLDWNGFTTEEESSCPSWTNLVNVTPGDMAYPMEGEYDQASDPPSLECSATVVDQDFEETTPPPPPLSIHVWDGNGATTSQVVSDGSNSYFRVAGRTSAGHGPRVTLASPECLTPGATYLFSVKVQLLTSATSSSGSSSSSSACSTHGGESCPRLMLYRRLSSGGNSWKRLGVFHGKGLADATWGVFQLPLVFSETEVGPTHTNQLVALFLEGPEVSVDILIDDFVLGLAPPETFPSPPQVCRELIPNGNAEGGVGGNTTTTTTTRLFAFPTNRELHGFAGETRHGLCRGARGVPTLGTGVDSILHHSHVSRDCRR